MIPGGVSTLRASSRARLGEPKGLSDLGQVVQVEGPAPIGAPLRGDRARHGRFIHAAVVGGLVAAVDQRARKIGDGERVGYKRILFTGLLELVPDSDARHSLPL